MHFNTKDSSDYILKSIAIVNFVFILLAIILIERNPATGYEFSIYSSVPVIVWALLLGAIASGTGIIVNQAPISDVKRERYRWQIGLLLILLSNLIIVFLPYISNYAFSGSGDHLSHLGYVKGILQTGTINSRSVYPITHVIVSQLSSITGTSADVLINFIGPLFYLLFILFTYILSRCILPEAAVILATTASTILYCYYYTQVFPMGFAFITTVLVLYLYFKCLNSRSVAFSTLIIIMGCLIVFFHLITSFVLIIILLIMEFGKLFFNKVCIIRGAVEYKINYISFTISLLLFAILVLWVWEKFWIWNYSVQSISGWFHAELLVEPMTERASEAFDKLGLSTLGQSELFIKMYGHYFIYLVLSFIAISVILKKCFISLGDNELGIFLYSISFVPISAIWLTDYVRPLTTLSSGRIIWLAASLFPTLVGLGLYHTGRMEAKGTAKDSIDGLNSARGSIIRKLGIFLIIITCFAIGIFAIYPSPLTMRPNWAVSYSMADGQRWLLENGDSNVDAFILGSGSPYRYAQALYGDRVTAMSYRIENTNDQFPDHFNYHLGYASFGESIKGNRYIISRENYIKFLYNELYPKIDRFNENDFSRLKLDPSVDRLYTNDDTQILYAHEMVFANCCI